MKKVEGCEYCLKALYILETSSSFICLCMEFPWCNSQRVWPTYDRDLCVGFPRHHTNDHESPVIMGLVQGCETGQDHARMRTSVWRHGHWACPISANGELGMCIPVVRLVLHHMLFMLEGSWCCGGLLLACARSPGGKAHRGQQRQVLHGTAACTDETPTNERAEERTESSWRSSTTCTSRTHTAQICILPHHLPFRSCVS